MPISLPSRFRLVGSEHFGDVQVAMYEVGGGGKQLWLVRVEGVGQSSVEAFCRHHTAAVRAAAMEGKVGAIAYDLTAACNYDQWRSN